MKLPDKKGGKAPKPDSPKISWMEGLEGTAKERKDGNYPHLNGS